MQVSPRFISLRPYIQLFILLMVLLLPIFYFYAYTGIRGNFYAWHILGIPFADPLNALQSLMQGAFNGFWPLSTLLVGALLSLLLAFFCGRIFCSWFCPYGYLSELVWKLNSKNTFAKAKISAWRLRIIVVLSALILGVILGIPLLNHMSAPGLISLAPQELWRVILPSMGLVHSGAEGAIILPPAVTPTESPLPNLFIMLFWMLSPVMIILILEYVLKKRLWCAYFCPQALLLMIAARLGRNKLIPALKIHWQATRCTCKGDNPCVKACSLGINPRVLHKKVQEYDACINCGACVKTCAQVSTHQGPCALSLDTK